MPDLYYYPIQSQNHPDFNRIYFIYPEINNHSKTIDKVFTSVGELIEFDNEMKLCKDCTIFCKDQTATEWFKNKGFRRAVNATDFIGDIWNMNGSEVSIVWNSTSNAMLARTSEGYSHTIANFNFIYDFDAVSTKVIVENSKRQKYISATISMVRQNDTSFKVFNGGSNPVNSTIGKIFWNSVLPNQANSPTEKVDIDNKPIKVYKNIILMNGAKIRRGT